MKFLFVRDWSAVFIVFVDKPNISILEVLTLLTAAGV